MKNIRELILFEKPDVIQFQEVSPQMQYKLKSLQMFFPHNFGLNKPSNHFSSIILSKYPLISSRVKNNHAIITSLVVDNSEIIIIGIHLVAPLNSILTQLAYKNRYKNLSVPPEVAQANFKVTIKQMNYLKALVGNTNQNLVLMGDLNMTSVSKRFTNFLKETNLYTYTSYKHLTSTWPTFLPGFLGIST